MNYQTVCRICIGENSGMLSIFQYYKFSEQHCEIFKVITDCACVLIEKHDGFSEQICGKCLARLSEAYRFKKLCEESDYKFRNNLIENNETKIRSEFSEEETKIQYNEMQDLENADNSKVICNELTQIKTEEFYEEIKTEALSDYDEGVIQKIEGELGTTRLSCVTYGNTECEEPSISKDYTKNDPSGNSEMDYRMENDSIINENEIKSEGVNNYVDIQKTTEETDFKLTEIRKDNKQPVLILTTPVIKLKNTTPPTSGNWDYENTKFLLDRYKCYMSKVGQSRRFQMKKDMWEQISNDLLSIGTKKSAIQVQNRYKTLLRRKEGLLKEELLNFEKEMSKNARMERSVMLEMVQSSQQIKILKENKPRNSIPTSKTEKSSENSRSVKPKSRTSPSTSCGWEYEDSKFLVSRFNKYILNVGPMKIFKTKKNMWEQISTDFLQSTGTHRTALQIENRYKNIIRRRKKLKIT